MATFHYKAYTARGAVTAGTIVADGLDAAIDALYGSGLTPFETYGVADQTAERPSPVIRSADRETEKSIWKRELVQSNRFSLKELTAFTVELASLTNSGLTLDAAFRIIAGPGASPKTARLAKRASQGRAGRTAAFGSDGATIRTCFRRTTAPFWPPAKPEASPGRCSSRSPNCWRAGSKFATRSRLHSSIP